jgi:acetolactate synthase-1/2/3 large subunit
MRVVDYIFKFLADSGVRHTFLVTGGGAMFLNDGLRCEKRITPICCHHEQGCAIAAEGYVRAGGQIGTVCVTSGPGGTNAITGVIGQWLDSIPVLYISGQVKFETTIDSCLELNLRQLGDQEINIIDIVKPVTKYAATVNDPSTIRRELEKAFYHALSGRPGPVWLNIPLNVQGAIIEEKNLVAFNKEEYIAPSPSQKEINKFLNLLMRAKRPLIVAGHGIILANAAEQFRRLLHKLNIPSVTTFNAIEILDDNDPLYFGRIGTVGQRVGNFLLQNADLIISLGSRNNIRQISYNWENYAKNAIKVVIDIDEAELKKKTLIPDLGICADVSKFMDELEKNLSDFILPDFSTWLNWCRERQQKLPTITLEQKNWKDKVNPYFFVHELTKLTTEDTDIIAGNGTACVALFQCCHVKTGQRIFWNSGCASMGYDIPATLGAAIYSGRKTVCLAGDGSFMMNMQELQVIIHHKLPVKIFLFDNDGYVSIKQTQKNFFGDELIGCDAISGISFPNFLKIAEAFGSCTFEITSQDNLEQEIQQVLDCPGTAFCVVKMPSFFNFSPKLSSKQLENGKIVSASLEDMYPFLEKEEYLSHMHPDVLASSK